MLKNCEWRNRKLPSWSEPNLIYCSSHFVRKALGRNLSNGENCCFDAGPPTTIARVSKFLPCISLKGPIGLSMIVPPALWIKSSFHRLFFFSQNIFGLGPFRRYFDHGSIAEGHTLIRSTSRSSCITSLSDFNFRACFQKSLFQLQS